MFVVVFMIGKKLSKWLYLVVATDSPIYVFKFLMHIYILHRDRINYIVYNYVILIIKVDRLLI